MGQPFRVEAELYSAVPPKNGSAGPAACLPWGGGVKDSADQANSPAPGPVARGLSLPSWLPSRRPQRLGRGGAASEEEVCCPRTLNPGPHRERFAPGIRARLSTELTQGGT